MRILFGTSIRTWGGGEEWMLSNARGLRDRGHDVRLMLLPAAQLEDLKVAIEGNDIDIVQSPSVIDPVFLSMT